MPSSIYTRLAATSLRLLTKYGRAVVMRDYTLGAGTYDTTTGVNTQSYIDEDRFAAKLPFARGQTNHLGTLIQATDERCLMDVEGEVVPATEDHVLFGDEEWKVMAAQAINPAGTPVLYDLLIRRA